MAGVEYLIGLDVGSSSVKAIALSTRDYAVIGRGKGPTPVDRRGVLVETPSGALRSAVDSALCQVVDSVPPGSRPIGLATASYGESGAHVSGSGEVLRPPIFWQDQRSGEQIVRLVELIGAERLDAVVGHAPDPTWGIGRLMWVAENEPSILEETAFWLPMADLVTFWLTGQSVTSPGLASRIMAFDQQKCRWSEEVLSAAGIDPGLLPPILNSGTAVGVLTEEAARRTGLPVGLTVSLGGHDRQCGSFAAGGPQGDPVDSAGTAEGVLVPRRSHVDERNESCSGIARYRDVVPGRVTYAGRVGLAGGLLDWAGRSLFDAVPALDDLLAGVPTPYRLNGLVCVPTFGRYASPYWSPQPVPSVMYGMTVAHSRADLVQALLEAPAYSLRANLDLLDSWSGRRTDSFRVEGGLVSSTAALQVRADVTGRAVHGVLQADLGAIGAALLAGVGSGVFNDHQQPLEAFSPALRTVEPDAARSQEYAESYETTWLPAASFARELADASRRG